MKFVEDKVVGKYCKGNHHWQEVHCY